MNYVPLYIKTEYSLLESMIKINDLVKIAKEKNYHTLTITDSNMYGVCEFYNICISNDIKPIIGLEVKLLNNKFILYAKNNLGYKNLLKLSTIQSEINLTLDDLEKYSSDLICILPYSSKPLYQDLNKLYSNFYIGYKDKEELSKLRGNNLIYTNEINVLNKENLGYLKYLKAIKESKLLDEIEFNCIDTELKDIDYIVQNYPEHLNNNKEIIDMCHVKLEKEKDLLPVYECPDNLDPYKYLKLLCKNGLEEKIDNINSEYMNRIDYELNIINKMGFCNYFLVVWDYVNFARKNNILCHARGSAAGSLVAYVLSITDVDPIKYNLIFERFLNPERISMPDIDMDFDSNRRDEVIDYCIKKYGEKKATGIITFTTFKPKLAIRDVARTMNISQNETDYICKLLIDKQDNKNLGLLDNYKMNKKLKDFIDEHKSLKELYKLAIKIEGLKKNTSIHAAGIVICSKDIDEVVPLQKSNNIYLTGYSMEYLENLGLLKMDFLGLRNLTLISNILNDINEKEKLIDFHNIPLDDNKTLELFYKANTIGIFQFEKTGMISFLKKLKVTTFEDIYNALALYRPGPMKNIDTYIRRREGKEKVDYIESSLEPILRPTYGIIVYQEQIIKIANVMAGFSLGQADILRKAVSKKKTDMMEEQLKSFKDGAIKNNYSDEVVSKVCYLILKFAEYGFNKSHSVAYAMIAYKLAYLKAHYPAYFMKNLMTMAIGSSLSTKDYIYECKLNNIGLLKPDINYSNRNYIVINNKLVYPFGSIKNIGITVVDTILKERKNGKFSDIYDFIKRTYGKAINKRVLNNLIDSGCFDSFNINKHTLTDNLDIIINYCELLKDIDEEYAMKPEIEYKEEYNKQELMKKEYDVFGFYLTNNPITEYKTIYKDTIELKDVSSYFNKKVKIVVSVRNLRVIKTKNNDDMCFLLGEDEISSIELVLFPKIYEQNKNLKIGDIVYIEGKIEKRFSDYQVIIDNFKILK